MLWLLEQLCANIWLREVLAWANSTQKVVLELVGQQWANVGSGALRIAMQACGPSFHPAFRRGASARTRQPRLQDGRQDAKLSTTRAGRVSLTVNIHPRKRLCPSPSLSN